MTPEISTTTDGFEHAEDSKREPNSNTSNMADADWILEAELARQLGVDRELLRPHRPAWDTGLARKEGNRVWWLKKAAAQVAEALGVTLPDGEKPAPTGTPEAARAPVVEVLTVVSGPRFGDGRHFPNSHVIEAQRATGQRVNVRVNCPGKFVPRAADGTPMSFEARLVAEYGYWQLTGREPRWVGKW